MVHMPASKSNMKIFIISVGSFTHSSTWETRKWIPQMFSFRVDCSFVLLFCCSLFIVGVLFMEDFFACRYGHGHIIVPNYESVWYVFHLKFASLHPNWLKQIKHNKFGRISSTKNFDCFLV